MTCLKCDKPTVEKPPADGGSVSLRQLFCADHLKEALDSGDYDPIQVPVPEK